MRETIEFRIPEAYAAEYLPSGTGELIGGYGVRKVIVNAGEPLFFEIGRLHRVFRSQGRSFFFGREYHRRYSRRELDEAELFHVWPRRVFEPAGEECGTEYDESTACPECGAGATQVSELRLDLRKVPRGTDFAETIAGEQIVSQRLAECLIDAGLQGFTLVRALHKARYEDDPVDLRKVPTGREILRNAKVAGVPHPTWSFWVWLNRLENRAMLEQATAEHAMQKRVESRHRGAPVPVWYQFVVSSPAVEISPLTRAGSDPFDDDNYGRCPQGHVIGLNLLSEVAVTRGSLPNADVMETKQMVGVRRGLLRPRPVLLLSSQAWRAVEAAKLRGLNLEVAHLS